MGGSSKKADDKYVIPSCFTDTHGVITSTMNDLPGYKVTKILGTVYGITVRARNWGADIGGALRTAVGGEIRIFTNLMYTSREEAMERLVGECMSRGGNAIIAVRFDVASFGSCSQICAYGTACLVEKVEER
ncbi:Putative UPF0145 domain protein [Penicillium brasilianum]|uniref:Putative UPF0145 domain protein n=1 Tax=Penicillium brasilianum TaxID=104259 RepID=A0A0F7TZQ1_PENBI|nr:Putative UPF0145 domain protein [Penicillium brasilianum]